MNKWISILMALAMLSSAAARAADVPKNSHSDTNKTTPPLPGYRDYQTLTGDLHKLVRPPSVTLRSLTKTAGGREMPIVTLTRGEPDQKPAILILGNVRTPLILGAELATRMAQRLAADTPENQALLDRITFYIIPVPDPDATAALLTPPFAQRTTNLRPTDEDHDGEPDEDGPDDLNHDGLITLMRIEDSAGTWIPHPTDPRILIEADPKKNEQGKYKLHAEGLDNDHDGKFNEDGAGGVAFDRNFPFEYPYFGVGAGPHQLSEPQTRAVAQFILDHPNIAGVFCFSDEDNLVTAWKPGPGSTAKIRTMVAGGDAPVFDYLTERYREAHKAKDAPAPAEGHGSFVPWVYYHAGRWSLATRGWWMPMVKSAEAPETKPAEAKPADAKPVDANPAAEGDARKDDAKQKPAEDRRGADQLNALRWLGNRKIDGLVEWTPINHPNFPGKKVEVGGFKPFLLLNPPADLLDGLADEHTQFIRQFADLLPRIAIGDVKVEPLGGNVHRITAAVVNNGYLPSMSEMGKANGVPWALEFVLELPQGAALLKGLTHQKLDPIGGKGGRSETVWLLRTDAVDVKLRVGSPATGSDTKTVKLK